MKDSRQAGDRETVAISAVDLEIKNLVFKGENEFVPDSGRVVGCGDRTITCSLIVRSSRPHVYPPSTNER